MFKLHVHVKYLLFQYVGMHASGNSVHDVLIGFY